MPKDLTTSQIDRQNILNNDLAIAEIQKKSDSKGILFEGKIVLTKELVAAFYEVDVRTIERYMNIYSDELSSNGFEILKGKRLNEFITAYNKAFATDINVARKIRAMSVFDFRAFLNIGMLLSESEKARILRQMMLDIVIDLINKKTGGATKYINQRDKDYISASLQEDNYRRQFTDALKHYVVDDRFKYAHFTDLIYVSIFKEKAKEYKKILDLKASDKVRDTFYSEILDIIAAYECGLADFEACGCLGSTKAEQYIATSGDDLIKKLKGNPSFIFTLIHKFNKPDEPPIIPDHDIIVLSDEAHRTQNGIFADNMCILLPTASRIGFTGTPLFAYDNVTERTFGGYVSIYDFKRAVDDGATVPLYYENRADLLGIENPEINDKLLDAIEQADLNVNQQAKLEQELAKDIHVLTSKKRLDTIAKDFVEHCSELWTTGKSMFVCINKVTAVRMYNLVQEYWILKIKEIEDSLSGTTQQEYMEVSRKLEWMKKTEMAVIISQEQNEIATFEKWGLDIKPHRTKMEKREMDKEFKDPDNPFRVVFVCAMWLTGFDVKCLSTIYLDKPLKAHTLMQTIARANRVYEGKINGLIVDYVGVVKALRKALADYTKTKGGTGSTDPAPDKTELLSRIYKLLAEIAGFMEQQGFNLPKLVKAVDFEKLALVQSGANAMCVSEDVKKRFEVMARELFKLFKYVEKQEVSDHERAYKNAISAVYDQMQEKRKHSDNTDLMIQLHDIVSEYITVINPADRVSEDGANYLTESRRFDISHIDFERLQQEFARVKNKNLLMKDLEELINDRLDNMMRRNPMRINYYERYQTIIQEYNAEQDKAAIEKTFIDLTNFVNDLDEEEKRYVREGFNNDEELAMYDLLLKDSLTSAEIKKIKKLAKVLLERIKGKISELDHWTEKEETQAAVDVIIRDTLWSELPESYDDGLLNEYRRKIYEFVYSTYPAA